MTIVALFDLAGGQVLLILTLVLIFLGAKKLPELVEGFQKGIEEFRKAAREAAEQKVRAIRMATVQINGQTARS